MPVLNLSPSDTPTAWVTMPTLDECFVDADQIPEMLLRPMLRVDGDQLAPNLAGIPLVIVGHEVGIDDIEYVVEADGRYRITRYAGAEVPHDETASALAAYIDEAHGSAEELQDENEELFDEDEPRAHLQINPGERQSGDVEVHALEAAWIQNTQEPPVAEQPDFALALMRHPILFGAYYLFVDPVTRRVRQVFQCT